MGCQASFRVHKGGSAGVIHIAVDSIQIDSDTALLARYARQRDAGAFAELVKRYAGLVFSTARRITGDSHDAEDVTQQCFLEMAQRAARVTAPVGGWLYRVAYSRSLNARRNKATRREYENKASPEKIASEEATWAQLEPLIDDAIAALPDEQRLPIILHFLEQKSQGEVARELEIDQSTVSRRIGLGIETLRQRLKESGVDVSVATLGGLMAISFTHTAPATLSASLIKVGLAGIGKATTGVSSLKLALAAIFLLILGSGAAILIQMSAPKRGPAVASSQPAGPSGEPAIEVQDAEGHPVSNALVSASVDRIYFGQRTDENGRLPLSVLRPAGKRYFVYSQRSGRMGIFSVADLPPEGTLPVTLDFKEASVDGCVVNSRGDPIAGVVVRIYLTTPNNQTILLARSQGTDSSGYYSVSMIPSRLGMKIRASLSNDPNRGGEEIATGGKFQIEMPDLLDHSGLPPAGHPGPKRVRYSGKIVNENGHPIENVIVSMQYPFLDGVTSGGIVVSDAQGRFSRLAPPGAGEMEFRLNHPEYIGQQFSQVAPDPTALKDGSAVIVMKKGVSVTGKICDESGKPIFNALVLAGGVYSTTAGPESEPIEDSTTCRTDANGHFRIGGLPPGVIDLEATANGFAPGLMNVDVSAGSEPIAVTLVTGGTYSAQVVDSDGNAVPDAAVGCQSWAISPRMPLPLSRFTKTDAMGRFTLTHLPLHGKLTFYTSHKGFVESQFTWSASEKSDEKISLYRPPVIAGFVRDAATDQPITKFALEYGVYWSPGKDFQKFGTDHVNSASGQFRAEVKYFSVTKDMPGAAARIVADGYLPQMTPTVTMGKRYEPFVIRMVKAAEMVGKVETEAGEAVGNAKVWLVGPKDYTIVRGLSVSDMLLAAPTLSDTTDRSGRFRLPPAEPSSRVLVLCESGYAIVKASDLAGNGVVKVKPWGRVTGRIEFGGKAINGNLVGLQPADPSILGTRLGFRLGATSRTDGTFEIDYVPEMRFQAFTNGLPGERNVDVIAGRTTVINLSDTPETATRP